MKKDKILIKKKNRFRFKFNRKQLVLKGLFLKKKNINTFRTLFDFFFNIYNFKKKSKILNLVVNNINFISVDSYNNKNKGHIGFIKKKFKKFGELEQEQKDINILQKKFNNTFNSNFIMKKHYLKTSYLPYFLSLNGKLSFKPFTISNNFLSLMKSVKFIFRLYYKLMKKKESRRNAKKNNKMDSYDIEPLVNLLKIKQKFQYISKDFFRGCCIYFKYTGSNIFGTITNNLGEVVFSYSAGVFKNVKTRKEKTTIFIAKQLGELIALRLYKSNAEEISFIPFMNHRKARSLMKFLISGFRLIRFFKLAKFIINRKVMRNGVRLRKIARK